MPEQITVRVELGPYAILGRDVDWVEVHQSVGDHIQCSVVFDRDPRSTSPLAKVQLAELADAPVRVVFLDAVGDGAAGEGGCLAFEGRVREARVAHQPAGGGRFTVTAVSDSYALAAHADRRYWPSQTLATLAGALGVSVVAGLPGGEARSIIQRGESDWALLARAAAAEGVQLRPAWPRGPQDASPPEPAELGQGFTDVTHALTWGRDLLSFETVLRPVNPGVTGAFYDPAAKHDHRFRGVRQKATWLGGARPVVDAAERVSTTDANGGDPGHLEPGAFGGSRARTQAEFRTRLERASTARAGSAVEATGASTQPGLRAGDRIQVQEGTTAGAGAPGAGTSEAGATGSGAGTDGASSEDGAGGAGAPPALPSAWGGNVGADERAGMYGLVRVTHRWTGTQYENEFAATPWADYHPAPAVVERQLATSPVHQAVDAGGSDGAGAGAGAGGLTLGVVVANNDPKGRGRVKVRFAWMADGEQSHWVRVAGMGGGNGRGLGILPQVGDEVVVAAVGGDPEHPVVLGALWNGTDRAGHAPGMEHWVTPSGSTLSMAEGPSAGKQTVKLCTPGGNAMIQLDASGPLVTIHSEGDLSIEAPNGELRLHAKSMTTHVDTDAARVVNGKADDYVKGNLTIQTDARYGVQGATVQTVSKGTLLTHAAGALTTYSGAQLTARAAGAHVVVGAPVALNPE